MNEKLNIEICTTAAESLFRNGTVECHNLMLDEKCEPEITLARTDCAKNALQNHFGHSPNELVIGSNINTLSILTDQLPTLEATTTCNLVRVSLNALHAARKSFIEAESGKKIQRVLKSKVKTDEGFVTSDSVYYRRQSCKG